MKYSPATFRTAYIATAAVLALASGAHAAPTGFELDSIKVYGDVTIAKDSVTSWGPWEQFEAPTAGPAAPQVAATARPADYRPLPTLTTSPLMAFGFFVNPDGSNPNAFVGTGAISNANSTLPLLGDSLTLQLTAPAGGQLLVSDTGAMPLQPSASISYGRADGTVTFVLRPGGGDGTVYDPGKIGAMLIAQASLQDYLGSPSNQYLIGVVGNPTSATQMNSLRNGNVQATYTGQAYGSNGSVSPLSISVDFGSGTGSYKTNEISTSIGVRGNAIVATSPTVRIDGAFFGRNAASVGGNASKGTYHEAFLGVK